MWRKADLSLHLTIRQLCGRRELSLQLRQWQLWKFNGVKNSLCDALALLGKGVRLGVFNSTGVELPV